MAKETPIECGGGNSHQRSVARGKTKTEPVAVPAVKEADTHKSFKAKLGDFADHGITQTAVGILLVGIGALISVKTAMVVAFFVFLSAAYRVGLFKHKEPKRRIASYIGVPVVLGIALFLVWTLALKSKTQVISESLSVIHPKATEQVDKKPEMSSPETLPPTPQPAAKVAVKREKPRVSPKPTPEPVTPTTQAVPAQAQAPHPSGTYGIKDASIEGVRAEGANGFGVQHVIWNGGKVDQVTYDNIHDCTGKAKDVIANNGDVSNTKYHDVGSGDCAAPKPVENVATPDRQPQ